MTYINNKKNLSTLIITTLLVLFTLGGCAKSKDTITNIVNKNSSYKNLSPSIAANIPLAAAVRENELSLINLNNNTIIALDTAGSFFRPIISPDKSYVAYLKNDDLYIAKTTGEKSMVQRNISLVGYAWLDKNTLLYSPESGGLYAFDTEKKESNTYIENKYTYHNITIGIKGSIYAEKYLNYTKDGAEYRSDYGMVLFQANTKNEELIVKAIPTSENGSSLGMYPVISGISKDLRFLFIFEHPHSASTASDGVSFASYDTKTKKYISYGNKGIFTLTYKDNLSSSEADWKKIAFINGGGREMKSDKILGILNLTSGSFEQMSSKDQAAMTPCFSADGKTVLYAASQQGDPLENVSEWMKKGNHNIYSVDINSKEITQLTNSLESFDFAPMCIKDRIFVYFRSNLMNNVSMWTFENGKETKIIDGLLFSENDQYPVDNYYGHFDIYNYVDVKY